MAVCSNCGKELGASANFCKSCGERQTTSTRNDRKARVLAEEKRRPLRSVVIGVAVLVIVAGWAAFSLSRSRNDDMSIVRGDRSSVNRAAYVPVTAENGEVRVPLSSLQGDKASYYVYAGGGREIRFFLLKTADGSVRAALDACTSCYHAKLGYRQEGDAMVCNNCGMGFRSTDVGIVTGGCSPIPVEKRMDGRLLVLKVKELEEGARYF
jgi:uncharacterized membrane protein